MESQSYSYIWKYQSEKYSIVSTNKVRRDRNLPVSEQNELYEVRPAKSYIDL